MYQPRDPREIEGGSEQDEILHPHPEPARWGWKRAAAGAAASVVLLLTGAAVASRRNSGLSSAEDAEDAVGLDAMVYTPSHDQCSAATANCLATGCCQTSGYKCYTGMGPGVGKCMKKPCQGCTEVAPKTVAVNEYPGMSLFCFTYYMDNSGSTEPNYELDLIKQQKMRGVSIFRCSEQAVYSDIDAVIAPGLSTIKVTDLKGDFHFAKRKHTGKWVNTGMYVQVWQAIGRAGVWARHNYVVKVDATAVFFANKLVEVLRGMPVPAEGVYMENCPFVEYGYFGNLEVFSKNAFGTLLTQMEDCYHGMDWKTGIKKGKYGPMGEDLFAQKCMDRHGVKKVERFDLTRDGSCPADRPKDQKKNRTYVPSCPGSTAVAIHPMKTVTAYFKCMEEADQAYPA